MKFGIEEDGVTMQPENLYDREVISRLAKARSLKVGLQPLDTNWPPDPKNSNAKLQFPKNDWGT